MENHNKGPKVSIITVCYNSADTITDTIKSVINQTYSNIEYIIIDGGSTDGTVEIIKKYSNNINYWVSEPDNGIYDAMNKGIKLSSGEIIGIINSDDWYSETVVENAVLAFKQNECDVIHGDIVYTYFDGKPYVRCLPDSQIDHIWHDMIFHHPTCFVHKNVYKKFGLFRTDLHIAADYAFFLYLYIKKAKIIYLDSVVVYMRDGGASYKSTELGYKEVRAVSIQYGYSRYKANIWFLYKISKYYIINCLRRLKLQKVLSLKRRVTRRQKVIH